MRAAPCRTRRPRTRADRQNTMTSAEVGTSASASVRIRDVMDAKTARILLGQPLRIAAETLVTTQASDLMVIDHEQRFVGVIPEGDLLAALIPDFEGLAEAGATLSDAYRAFLRAGDDLGEQPIDRLVIRRSVTVEPDDELLKAATVMVMKGIRRLAVVDAGGRFLGSVSRADVCWGVLVEAPARGRAASAAGCP